ncbi:MAG: hypothetical protein K5793_04220 [Nitrosarchaeum sp.]|nr:hypothetical protein [Nitrosarchaeum sp.]
MNEKIRNQNKIKRIIKMHEDDGVFDSTERCAYEIGVKETQAMAFTANACNGMKSFTKEHIISNIELGLNASTSGIILLEHGNKINILELKWCQKQLKKFRKRIKELNELRDMVENEVPSNYFKKFEILSRRKFGNNTQF